MTENRFTPATIGMHKFTIPLYQRLFEWEEEQVPAIIERFILCFQDQQRKSLLHRCADSV